MRRVSVLLLVVPFFSCFAMTQSSDQSQGPSRVELFGGYTYINPDFSLVSGTGVSGWNASANFKVHRSIGLVADVSGFYPRYTYGRYSGYTKASGNTYTFLFGPQISIHLRRFTPFGRFFVGVSHVSQQTIANYTFNEFKSNTALSLATGGGLDYSVARHIAIRGAVDWLYAKFTPIGGGDPGANYVQNRNVVRISTGMVFRF